MNTHTHQLINGLTGSQAQRLIKELEHYSAYDLAEVASLSGGLVEIRISSYDLLYCVVVIDCDGYATLTHVS